MWKPQVGQQIDGWDLCPLLIAESIAPFGRFLPLKSPDRAMPRVSCHRCSASSAAWRYSHSGQLRPQLLVRLGFAARTEAGSRILVAA